MTDTAGPPAEELPLDAERGAQLLDRLVEVTAFADRAQAEAAQLAALLAGSGMAEQLEGLPLDLFLTLEARQRCTDARQLITAGEVLLAMPVLAGLVQAGQVSWSVTRQIVFAVRSFGAKARGEIDQRLAATVHDHGGIDAFDPDRLVDAVELAVRDARSLRSVERTEERVRRSNYVAVQADLDGGIRGHFRFDAVTGAVVLNALDDAAAHIGAAHADAGSHDGAAHAADHRNDDAASHPIDDDDAGDAVHGELPDADKDAAGDDGGWQAETARGRQYAEALTRMAHCWLTGGRDTRAKPAFVVHVQAGDVTASSAGHIQLAVRGALPAITMATLDQLATDATLRTVIFDGARPLATARKRQAATLPADVRFAILARDRGCRFPGSRDPADWCDVHHTTHRADGGDHHPDGLVALARKAHVRAHRHGWTLAVAPDTGAVTATRRGRTYRSLPPGTPLSRRVPDRPPDTRPRGRPAAGSTRGAGGGPPPPRPTTAAASRPATRTDPPEDAPPLPF
jgi:hypothetical protein